MIKNIIKIFKESYISIGIGIVGGYLGTLIKLPLPWLLGALALNFLFAFTKAKITFSQKLLTPIFLIIGIILGGSFDRSLLYKIHLWIFSSIAMVLVTFLGTVILTFYFYKVCKFKKLLAVLAGLPGAFAPIVTTLFKTLKNKNDFAKVVIPQATRVIFIISFLPFLFINKVGFADIKTFSSEQLFNFRYFFEISILILSCVLVSFIFQKLKIPSSVLIASMFASGLFYTLELISSRFPELIINLTFVFLGTALGTRMNGIKSREFGFYMLHGVIVSIILLIIAAITAYILSIFFGFNFMSIFLSFVPGGIHEMVLISIAYNIDPIFVSYHHFLRIFIIVLALPVIIKKFKYK